MADFANAARAFNVKDAANLEVGLTVTVHIEDELENILRRSSDHGSPFAADHEGFRHRLLLRPSLPDPFREQAKISQPEATALGQPAFDAHTVENRPGHQISPQRVGYTGRLDDL